MLDLQQEVDRMSWREGTRVSLRKEFVQLALQAGSNRRELCRRFGIAPKTGYKWLARYAQEGASGLEDRSRRPRRSPMRTGAEVERRVIELRLESRNSWGGRKLARLLQRQGGPAPAPRGLARFRRRARTTSVPALRTRGAQRTVADGLQRPLRLARPRPLPSAD